MLKPHSYKGAYRTSTGGQKEVKGFDPVTGTPYNSKSTGKEYQSNPLKKLTRNKDLGQTTLPKATVVQGY